MKLLHVTAHLGGGVGRALSRLADYRQRSGAAIDATFACLETPQDRRFADAIIETGASVVFAPDLDQLRRLIAENDIVQLEWWHHPLMARTLLDLGEVAARFVVWSHVSGLHYPAFPDAFLSAPHAFLFTTPASARFAHEHSETTFAVVNSSGGFDDLPDIARDAAAPARFGYLGAFNPAKIHPRFLDFARAVDLPGFVMDMYGDASVNPELSSADEPRIRLHGFVAKPAAIFPKLDVLAYLLNPSHYGTTENALLEAMASGIVPVVMDNPVEAGIVDHMETGIVVRDAAEFAQAVRLLAEDASLRLRLSRTAAERTRQTYSIETTARQLEDIYRAVLPRAAKRVNFAEVFGAAPQDIFTSCLGSYARLFTSPAAAGRDGRMAQDFIYEESKSSVSQFRKYFGEDDWLDLWADIVAEDQSARSTARGHP